MLKMSLGNIEVYGLAAALEAADVATKSANVKLIGYEATDGLGMVAVKIEGDVSAVQSAISAAKAAAERISKVFATSVIPRPSSQLETVVDTDVTVGRGASPSARPLESKPHPRDHKPEDAAPAGGAAETKTAEPQAAEAPQADQAPEGTAEKTAQPEKAETAEAGSAKAEHTKPAAGSTKPAAQASKPAQTKRPTRPSGRSSHTTKK